MNYKFDNPQKATQAYRWAATVSYRAGGGIIEQYHEFDELDDLGALVERGPHWDCILYIEIERTNPTYPGLTLEKADRLMAAPVGQI